VTQDFSPAAPPSLFNPAEPVLNQRHASISLKQSTRPQIVHLLIATLGEDATADALRHACSTALPPSPCCPCVWNAKRMDGAAASPPHKACSSAPAGLSLAPLPDFTPALSGPHWRFEQLRHHNVMVPIPLPSPILQHGPSTAACRAGGGGTCSRGGCARSGAG